MSERFRVHHDPEVGFELPVHSDWVILGHAPECALVAVEPKGDTDRFLASVVVTIEELLADESLDAWVQRSRQSLADGFNRLQILDTEEIEISGRRACRTLSHYLHPHAGGVNLEQWSVAQDAWGFVISCSFSALAYDEMTDVTACMAEGLQIHDGPAVSDSAEGAAT